MKNHQKLKSSRSQEISQFLKAIRDYPAFRSKQIKNEINENLAYVNGDLKKSELKFVLLLYALF